MLSKLAFRNARRSIKDYLIYLITISISFSLILAFNLVANSDEVVKLSSGMDTFKNLLIFINIVIVFALCFLINYTTRFMLEKRSKELGIYMLLGIKKIEITKMFLLENMFLGFFALMMSIPLGFLFSQFASLVIVRLLAIPEVIFISLDMASIGLLFIYFLAIYILVLSNMYRKVRKMTVHDFLYLEKQNEEKMFHNNKKRNSIFIISLIIGTASLWLWHSRCNMENFPKNETLTYLMLSMTGLIISIYGISATCADMLLSVILKSKKLKYKKDNLFVTRTFASKARTMSFTFGTLSMLILFAILCLNFSSINKGIYQSSIELNAPYDVTIMDNREAFEEYINVIKEDYTINHTVEYDVYKEINGQIQKYFDIQFYDFDPIIKLSDYNSLLTLRNMETIKLKENEFFIVTSSQSFHKFENNDNIKTFQLPNGKKLQLKGIDTKVYWYSMFNTGDFAVIVPDKYVQGMEISESHLIVDTKEDTTSYLDKKIKTEMTHRLVKTDENGKKYSEYYRVQTRGLAIEEQNTMTAMIASICLYIAFILISAVGTILAIQSLSDSAKYKYRYLTLRRLGVNDKALYHTIRKQLFILFGVPVVYSVICSFCMLASINNVYQTLLNNKFAYLFYFAGGLAIFFLIYGVYWIATYIGFKRTINENT